MGCSFSKKEPIKLNLKPKLKQTYTEIDRKITFDKPQAHKNTILFFLLKSNQKV